MQKGLVAVEVLGANKKGLLLHKLSAIPLTICLFVVAMGCSSTGMPAFERVGVRTVEVALGQQSLGDLALQATTISVPLSEDNDAWVRARYFFQTYTTGNPLISEHELASDLEAKDPLQFKVLRRRLAEKVEYSMFCSDFSDKVPAERKDFQLQAQNLARFIQSGILSGELLSSKNTT
jgi:hypothetical protein